MIEPPQWQFDIEVRPAGWHFPASKSWIAGWIRPPADQTITDVRARLHHRVILGLAGLPHPAFKDDVSRRPESCRPGFSFLFTPQPGATLLRLEARDQSGRWTEFFRTRITTATGGPAPAPAPALSQSLRDLITALLRRRMRSPGRTWTDLADELVAAFVAEPLNAHPNAPFIGALEEPHDIGRLRFGLIPVTGWLAHPHTPITRLLAVIDPLPAIMLPHGLTRQDIAKIFPALDGQANSAFVGEVALPPEFAAPVLLKVFAELGDGGQHLVFARRFTPRYHGASGELPPLITGFTFARVLWALHRAAGRFAWPRHGFIRAARTIWNDYQAKPAYRPKKHPLLPGGFPFRRQERLRDRNPAGVRSPAEAMHPASTVIAPTDDMCVPDAAQYFQLGREALALVQQACLQAGVGRIEAILDLPCGYGRVARWLRAAYPTARLHVCDTQGAGVAFCLEQLGATGVQAAVDGRHWEALPGPYDIIWCGSLLTHFDRDQWVTHLQRFSERLTPHGVLVFTSHGLLALDKLQSGEKDYGLPQALITRLGDRAVAEGFGYVDYPDTPAYGISVAQPGWILDLITQETELQVVAICEAAWDQHQDLVVCTRRQAEIRS